MAFTVFAFSIFALCAFFDSLKRPCDGLLFVLLTLNVIFDRINVDIFVKVQIKERIAMDYIFSFLLIALNLIDYEVGISRIVFFMISLFIFGGMIYFIQKKTRDFLCTCITAMCHVWPISWVNVFGDSCEVLQLPWFYILGAFIAVYFLWHFKELMNKSVNTVILSVYVTFFIVSIYPIMLSPSKEEAFKEFIMIFFFVFLCFVAFICSSSFDEIWREHIVSAYIWVSVLTSLLLIIQNVLYSVFGIMLFKLSVGNYMGNSMISAGLLMEDTSCSTLMLGCAVFFMLERINEKNKPLVSVVGILLTVIGLALTTRRTSIISLIICFGLYVCFRYKKMSKKLFMLGGLLITAIIMISYLLITRPVDDLSQYLYENGRLTNYVDGLKLAVSNPLGIGYDNVNLIKYMTDMYVPHNTFIRWLDMGGFLFVLLLVIMLVYYTVLAKKKGLNAEFWSLIYCIIGMNFIPDLLNSRFFVIPCMLVLLSCSAKGKQTNEISNRRIINEKGTVLSARVKR